MPYCSNCGNEIKLSDRFCIKCGAPCEASFAELVNAAREGSGDAQAALYERTYRDKYFVALKYMKNSSDASGCEGCK